MPMDYLTKIAVVILIFQLSLGMIAAIPEFKPVSGVNFGNNVEDSIRERKDEFVGANQEDKGTLDKIGNTLGGEVFTLAFTLVSKLKWFFTMVYNVFGALYIAMSEAGVPNAYSVPIQSILWFIMLAGFIKKITGR